MRTLGTLASSRGSRNPLIAFGLFLLVIFLAYKAAQSILANDFSTLATVAILLIAGAVCVAVLNDWRRGLYILVVWILFEDFVRKYFGNNMAIYFAKDALAIILYISFFRARRAKKVDRYEVPFRLSLLVFFWFSLVQMFNPASTSIFYGILGMKVDFLYVPLLLVGYAFAESEENLRHFLSLLCGLILIVAGLGIAQSIIGPTFLNPQNLQEDIRDLSTAYRVSPITGLLAYRPTSVFVSGGRFQDFLIVAWIISLGYGGYLILRTRRGRTLVFTTIGVVAAASVMSASRGVIMWNAGVLLLFAAGFLWGAPWRQREALRVVRAIQRMCLLIGIGLVLLLTIFPEALGSRMAIYTETLMPDSPASELVQRTQTYPLKQLVLAFEHERWPYGYGTGTCTLGGQYVVRIMHAMPMFIGVESGYGNLVVELGVGGLILWIVLSLSIGITGWKVVVSLRSTPWFPLAFAIWLYAMILLFPMMFTGNSPYQDFLLNSTLWLMLGILYRLQSYPKAFQIAQAQAASGQG
ncbi:MAG: hypothetical protein WBR14_02215 [Candidatus Acidiferrum sp.]